MDNRDISSQPERLHERILSVLGAFSTDRVSLTLSELASITQLPTSSAHRIANHLVEWGALEREGRLYVIGLRLFEIAALAPRAYRSREIIHPFLEELLMRTRENVIYSVLEGGTALVVEHLSGHRAVKLVAGVGERVPLHASAMGQVMLAFGPPSLLDDVLTHALVAYSAETVVDPAQLRSVIRHIRTTSVAVSSAFDVSAVSIAAPIFTGKRSFIGAVSIVTRRDTDDIAAQSAAVLAAARGISSALAEPANERSAAYRNLHRTT